MTNEKLDDLERLHQGFIAKAGTSRGQIDDSLTILQLIHGVKMLQAELYEQCRINGMGSEREAKLLTENQELRIVMASATRFVIPGEVDSVDAYMKKLNDLRLSNQRLQSLLSQVEHSLCTRCCENIKKL